MMEDMALRCVKGTVTERRSFCNLLIAEFGDIEVSKITPQ